MRDLKLDETGDLIIDRSSGNLEYVQDEQETEQLVTSVLNTFLNELDWNRPLGLNQTLIISSANDKNALQKFISDYLSEYLQGFESLTVNRSVVSDRTLNIDLTVRLTNGLVINSTIGGAN